MKSKKTYKKGQVFTVDFILGLFVFIFLLLLAVSIIIHMSPTDRYEGLYRNNIFLSEALMNEGYPFDWNESNVILPGLTTNNRLNLTKLKFFDNLTYSSTKNLFHLSNEYLFFFRSKGEVLNISGCSRGYTVDYIENCTINLSSISYSNLVKVERILIYNSSIVEMVVYSWN